MRILFVAHFFQPEPNFFMGLPFAKELAKRGHEVEVLTGFPNYPGGKVFEGYRIRPLQREVLEGIPVIRVPLYPSHDTSGFRRTVSYASFAFSASTIGAALVKPADVAYICQGPATLGLPGAVLRVLRGIPFVYDLKDLWPDGPEATGMFTNQVAVWVAGEWCKFAYKCASKVVVCTPGFKRKLHQRGVPEDKVEVIYNFCDDSHIFHIERDPELAKSLGMAGKFNIVFAGNIGKAQALDAVLDAAGLIASDYPRIQFLLIGGGIDVDSLKQKAIEMKLKNVVFLPRRPISEISAILALADVLFAHLKDEPIYKITIPSKVQAYMSAGRPILVAVGGDTNDLVTKAKAGLACEPENAESIANAVKKFHEMPQSKLDAMGANGKEFYNQELSFAIAVEKYEKIFESVVRRSKKTKS